MSQREVWNKLAIQWAKFRHSPQEGVEEFLAPKRGIVLDAGCGTGRNIIKGKKFVAFDFSSEMVDIGQKKLIYRDDVDFSVADACHLPFKSGKFDSALVVAVLHSMHQAEQEAMLKELNRVLKPGSEVLVTVWNRQQPRFFFKKKESYIDWRLGEKMLSRYYYLFTKKELTSLLKRHGFDMVSMKGSSKKKFGLFPADIIAIVKKNRPV